MKVCIVNFSGRRDGNCHDIAKFIEQTLSCQHEITLFEMCDMDVSPCGKCSYECFYKEKTCPYINDNLAALYTAICTSDLAYYIVPNYINYPNACFFIFNERKQGFFGHNTDLAKKYSETAKKFIVVSNTEEDNFRQILGRHVSEDSRGDFLFMATKDFDKGGVRGGMMESEEAKMKVRGFC